ncbi:MAG: glycosyltransferase, partial [Planctomycetes bacterium]|nr:glycosyltransferase [Planctomycetota bacterium]
MGLRVLHAVESLQPDAGSVAIVLPGLLRALNALSIDPAVVTLDAVPPEWDRATAATLDSPRGRQLVTDADLIHVHGLAPPMVRALVPLVRRAGKPLVISPLGALGPSSMGVDKAPPFGRRMSDWLHRRRTVRHAAAFAVLNDAESHHVRRSRCDGVVQPLPYGIDFADYDGLETSEASLPELPERRCLLALAPIHPEEGLVSLLRAVARLGPDFAEWHLVIAGPAPGSWRRQFEAAIARKGGADRVTFVVDPNPSAQRALLARSSLVASPGLRMRCPVSVLQALCAGVPVVTSVLGLPDDLPSVGDGVCVCGPTPDQLATALRRLVNMSDEELTGIGRNARDAACSRLDWSILADRYLELYSVIAQRRAV